MTRFLGVALVFAASVASASPHHAHWHYMVGARANAGKMFAKQLHFEATSPGPFSYALALQNARDLERLGREVADWTEATRKESTAEEVEVIATELETMRGEGERLVVLGAELGTWIDERIAVPAPPSNDELRPRIAERARAIFYGFDRVMAAHKKAERTLGIPTPEDPPPLP